MRALTFAAATVTGGVIAWAVLTAADRITWAARSRRLMDEIEVALAAEMRR